jgi:asparagine synthetase B (glutamine-hydrolysing)
MFFLALQKSQSSAPDLATTRIQLGQWNVAAGVMGPGEVNSQGGVTLVERWPSRSGRGRVRVRIEVRPDTSGYVVDVTRVMDSARRIYVHVSERGLFLASHVKLLGHAGVPIAIDDSRLAEVLLYRFVMPPATMFKGIRQVRPGESVQIKVTATGSTITTTSLLQPVEGGALSEDEVVPEKVADALSRALEDYGFDPTTYCTMLSGGLDSSALTCVGVKLFGASRTYSCAYGFELPGKDVEYNYAKTAAAALGTEHSIHVPNVSQFLHSIIDSVVLAEHPAMHLQTALLASIVEKQLATEGCKVWACGEGADGIFGQKIQMVTRTLSDRPLLGTLLRLAPVAAGLRSISRATNRLGMLADVADRTVGTQLDDPTNILWSAARFGERDWIADRYKGSTFASRAESLAPYANHDPLDLLMLLNFLGDVTQTQAVWSDVSEARGVHAFYPFSHPIFFDTVCSIPWSLKLIEHKRHLKLAAMRLGLPEFIALRPKASFSIGASLYGPKDAVLEPLVHVASQGFPQEELRSLQSDQVFKAQMLFTAINVGLMRRHFEMGVSAEALHRELDEAMDRLGLTECYTGHPDCAVAKIGGSCPPC